MTSGRLQKVNSENTRQSWYLNPNILLQILLMFLSTQIYYTRVISS